MMSHAGDVAGHGAVCETRDCMGMSVAVGPVWCPASLALGMLCAGHKVSTRERH